MNDLLIGIKYIVGLGNYSSEYINTNHNIRFCGTNHNVGFDFLDFIAEDIWMTKSGCLVSSIRINDEIFYLVKVKGFINLTGENLKKFIPENNGQILLVVDDLETEIGKFKVQKKSRGHRGHNGLRNLFSNYNDDFSIIRIGIGRPDENENVADYVLNKSLVDQNVFIEIKNYLTSF